MKTQKGQILRIGKFWYGRWRQDELVHPDDLTEGKERQKSR